MKAPHRTRLSLVAVVLTVLLAFWIQSKPEPKPTSATATPEKDAPKKRLRTQRTTRPTPNTDTIEAPPPDETDAERNTIYCQFEGDVELPERMHVRILDTDSQSESYSWNRSDDAIVLTGVGPSGEAVLYMRGHPRIEFTWTDSKCDALTLGETATVKGVVNNAYLEDTERAHVRGCGARGPIEEDGSFEIKISAEPCELAASRRDGPLMAVSDPVFLEPAVGDVIEVELDLPEHRMAGVGFSWDLVSGGIEVVEVHPDTPASDVGLKAGDTILMVDGESSEEMTRGDVRRTIGGEAGTQVELMVLRGDDEISLSFARESLDHAIPERRRDRAKWSKWGKSGRPW